MIRHRTSRSRFQVAPAAERTVDGIVFDSKKEATRYGELKLLERAGEIYALKCQPSFAVMIRGKKLLTYSADFFYIDKRLDGASVVEEVKSSGTRKDAAYRLRRKAAELEHGITVTEVIR